MLTLHDSSHGPDLIPDAGSLLEIQGRRGIFHPFLELLEQLSVAALQEQHDLPDHLPVDGLGNGIHACAEAPLKLMVEARPGAPGRLASLALPEPERPVDQPQGPPDRKGRGKRPEIPGPVLLDPAHQVETRVGLPGVETKGEELLVVPQDDIVARHPFSDQVALQDEGLVFRGREDILQVPCPAHHQGRLVGEIRRGFQIGEHPLPEVLGLAHIDHLLGGVLEEVYPGGVRQGATEGLRIQTVTRGVFPDRDGMIETFHSLFTDNTIALHSTRVSDRKGHSQGVSPGEGKVGCGAEALVLLHGFLIMAALMGCAAAKRPVPPLATLPGVPGHFGTGQILDLEAGIRIPFDDLIDRLASRDLIFVGEVHDNPEHHLVQVQILQALAGRSPLAMAMEFLQRPAQESLDRYVRGEIKESEFLDAVDWKRNWGYDFHFYRPLFQIAREKGIRVLAINAPSSIVRKVAREGLRGLTDEERKGLPSDLDLGNREHREYLFKAYTEHASPDLKRFEDFYEAQCVWDETMAETLAAHLKEKGGRLVVFAGNGHIIHKFGVPDRTLRRFPVPMATVLPYPVDGGVVLDRGMADFVWLTAGSPRRFTRGMAGP